ncbi:MAG: 3-oxoacyl-ACP synthase [Bacteroidetes bacterium]|nr:MAG: 3-oxoacyl-ACP synthase [Bacteroidota bacterium]REK05709.1 MAG: 3-oxoacyl-ACP synthase [Bacteroidota bacterium]REK31985.1 MAG: 3-oxoacyl-ACP synthase [Bacteroidota bacterium]REK50049.1 MAG: 3-oxoacyl-ACP synthase [Bacteroidota bacterium]
MIKAEEIKKELIIRAKAFINQGIEDARNSIASAQESRNAETKSSSGDKYETSRAMMQQEIDLHENQMRKLLELMNELLKIEKVTQSDSVNAGSLVFTSQGNFYVSVGMGAMNVFNETYFLISPASPLARAMTGLKSGEKYYFQGKENKILRVE